jgi:CelD/BcsL family acetyltransferase involved in cellulose biosynthesis
MNWDKLPATSLRDDATLRAAWDRLNAERLDLAFMSTDAMVAALEAFGGGAECLFVGREGARVAALFVLVPAGPLRWQSFQPSQLPLGAWVAEAGATLPVLCRELLRSRLRWCLALSLTQVDPLQAPHVPDEPDHESADYIDTAWIDIEGDFDSYWAARGKNLRQNMRKQRNRLATEGTATTLRIWHEAKDMAGAMARYGALESQGWKGRDGTAIHPDNAQGRFYTRLFEQAAERGEARVYEYLLGEHCAAMDLCLLRGGVLVMLKTAYDESMPKTLSPAFLLHEEELQEAFASGRIRRIEFYGRVMDWHTKFTDARRALYHLTTYRWPTVKAMARRRRSARHDAVPVEQSQASASGST